MDGSSEDFARVSTCFREGRSRIKENDRWVNGRSRCRKGKVAMGPLILGHRGSIQYPENTLKALSHAIESMADGVEIDIQMTCDGRFVLSHDENLKRLAGRDVDIRKTPYAQLKNVLIHGEPIATLEEALDLVRSWDRILDIEVKNPADFEALKDILTRFDCRNVIVSSFWHDGIDTLKSLLPGISVAYIYSHHPSDLEVYAEKADFLKPFYEYVTPVSYRKYAHKTIPWTVNAPDTADSLSSMGVRGIITDLPHVMVKHFRSPSRDTDHTA